MKERNMPSTSQGSSLQKSGTTFIPPKARLVAACVFFMLLTGVVFGRLIQVQFISSDRYKEWGDVQRSRIYNLIAPRGTILDRNNEPLAISLRTQTIWADPNLVKEPDRVARELAPILDLKSLDIYNKLVQDTAFVYLKRKVSSIKATQVKQLELDGIYTLYEYQRNNQEGNNLGLSIVGFVGSEDQGLGGVEYTFNDVLLGLDGRVSFEGNVWGNAVNPDLIKTKEVEQGRDLQLSIDKDLQFTAERLIKEAVNEYEALGGTILACNPRNGEILAMATALTGENGAQISDDNRAVTWAYEPGSAIKPVSFSAVLESGLGDASSIKKIPDSYSLYDARFNDHIPHPIEEWSISDILTVSSNVGTVFWAEDLGKFHLDYYLRKFGFGAKTNVELPGESEGLLSESKKYSGTSLATISLGQGIAVTPLQLLYAFNTIANDGIYVPPRLVLNTGKSDTWNSYAPISEPKRIISKATANSITKILSRVVKEGTGVAAYSKNYTVAGKTGTAQKPQEGGGYVDAEGNFHYITTFAGYFPAEDPEISIIVVIDEPQNSIYASETATKVFAKFAEYAAAR